MSKIVIKSILLIDSDAIINEGIKLGYEMTPGDTDGLSRVFFTSPNLSTAHKTALQTIINDIIKVTIT